MAGRYEELLESEEGRRVLNSSSGNYDVEDIDVAIEDSVKTYIKNSDGNNAEVWYVTERKGMTNLVVSNRMLDKYNGNKSGLLYRYSSIKNSSHLK